MKVRRDQDEEIKGKIAAALRAAVDKSTENAEGVAAKLKISTATLYKYMNGSPAVPNFVPTAKPYQLLRIAMQSFQIHFPNLRGTPEKP